MYTRVKFCSIFPYLHINYLAIGTNFCWSDSCRNHHNKIATDSWRVLEQETESDYHHLGSKTHMLKLYPSQGIFATIDTDRIIEIENVIFHSAHCSTYFVFEQLIYHGYMILTCCVSVSLSVAMIPTKIIGTKTSTHRQRASVMYWTRYQWWHTHPVMKSKCT